MASDLTLSIAIGTIYPIMWGHFWNPIFPARQGNGERGTG
jgi:hypothetical protein